MLSLTEPVFHCSSCCVNWTLMLVKAMNAGACPICQETLNLLRPSRKADPKKSLANPVTLMKDMPRRNGTLGKKWNPSKVREIYGE